VSASSQDSVYLPYLGPDAPIQFVWRRVAGFDSIEIVRGAGGFFGDEIRVVVRSDSLVGRIQEWDDGGSSFIAEAFTAVRVVCPTALSGAVE
jgi:hypothetical protein